MMASKKGIKHTRKTALLQIPAMPLPIRSGKWRFRCMIDGRQRCVIKSLLKSLQPKGQASFDRATEHLAALPQKDWTRPQASIIGDNIYVIHFKDQTSMQLRAFGHFHSEDKTAVLTLHGYEKDDTYYPANYIKRTADNRKLCDADHIGTTIACRYLDDALESNSEDDVYHQECSDCCAGN